MTVYVDRARWGARDARPGVTHRTLDVITTEVIHYADAAARATLDDEIAAVRAIQTWHMDHNGWLDIAYHEIIGMTGNVYQGRPPDVVGAHCAGFNTPSLGLCFLTDGGISPAAGAAAVDVVHLNEWVLHRKLDKVPHRSKTSTNCPDDIIVGWLNTVCAPGGPLA